MRASLYCLIAYVMGLMAGSVVGADSANYEETIVALKPLVDLPRHHPARDTEISAVMDRWEGISQTESLQQLLTDLAAERYRHQAQAWMFRAHKADPRTKGDLLAAAIQRESGVSKRGMLLMLVQWRLMDDSMALKQALIANLGDTSEFYDPETHMNWPLCNRAFDMLVTYADFNHLTENEVNFGVLGPSIDPDYRAAHMVRLRRIMAAAPLHFGPMTTTNSAPLSPVETERVTASVALLPLEPTKPVSTTVGPKPRSESSPRWTNRLVWAAMIVAVFVVLWWLSKLRK